MGVYDREYYRGSGQRYGETFGLTGSACKWLIIVNVAIFVLQIITHDELTAYLMLDTGRVMNGEVWRLLTYAFVHHSGDIFHILFNMLFLWWFGSDIEAIYGTKEFLAFYLVSAFLGGCVFELWSLANDTRALCVGASGAVTAVTVLCACHFPKRIILLFFVLPVPIWAFVVLIVGIDALKLLQGTPTGTAVQVHLAGAAFGFLYYKQQWRLTNLWPNIRAWRFFRSRPRLRVVRPEDDFPEHATVGAAPGSFDEQLEAKVDAVLEKVARSGKDSLTDTERQILLKASEVYRRRRT